MNRREFLAGGAMLRPLARLSPRPVAQRPASPPNVLFIMADDLGYADVSCYGRRDYSTPNIDSLAAQGMMFMQAYANSAACSATRTALITGRYQYRLPVGLEEPIATNSARAPGLPPEHPTLPSLLKKAGYATALIGKWHLGYLPKFGPLQSGYDRFWGFRSGGVDYFTHKSGVGPNAADDLWDGDMPIQQSGYLTNLLGDRAVAAIAEYAAVRRPFLISLHFNAPHWPWEGPDDEAGSRRIRALADYDGGTLKTYARMVQQMDLQIGRALQAIDAAGVANNTIVIFTSDNGGERFSDTWPFTGKKLELLEGGLRIPAIVRWPGTVAPASRSQQAAISMDWLPTLLEAAGTRPDPAYPPDGISLIAALRNSGPPVPRKLFWRYRANAQRAVRDGDMKWLEIAGNTFLFNVVDDPLERANLKTRRPELFQRLAAEFADWNGGMLPENPDANSSAHYGDQLADHYGNKRPVR
jgi:arylsulfatase A-like enzyme